MVTTSTVLNTWVHEQLRSRLSNYQTLHHHDAYHENLVGWILEIYLKNLDRGPHVRLEFVGDGCCFIYSTATVEKRSCLAWKLLIGWEAAHNACWSGCYNRVGHLTVQTSNNRPRSMTSLTNPPQTFPERSVYANEECSRSQVYTLLNLLHESRFY